MALRLCNTSRCSTPNQAGALRTDTSTGFVVAATLSRNKKRPGGFKRLRADHFQFSLQDSAVHGPD